MKEILALEKLNKIDQGLSQIKLSLQYFILKMETCCISFKKYMIYDNSSHPWKIIPSYLIDTYFGKIFKFHSNLGILAKKIKRFLKYYKQIFKRWSENLPSSPGLPSAIAS